MSIFVRPIFDVSFSKTWQNQVSAKIGTADLNSPRQTFFSGYLGPAVALTVRLEIDFVCFLATYKSKIITCHFFLGNVAEFFSAGSQSIVVSDPQTIHGTLYQRIFP